MKEQGSLNGISTNWNQQQKSSLNIHITPNHETSKYFACNVGSAKLSFKFCWNWYIKVVHERKKPFECTLCEANFNQNLQLKFHVHKGKKPFECSMCDDKFSLKGSLKNIFHLFMKEEQLLNATCVIRNLKHEII